MSHFSDALHEAAAILMRFDVPREFAPRAERVIAEIVKLESAVLRRKESYKRRDAMKLLPLKTGDELVEEYEARLRREACTLRSHVVIGALIVFAATMLLMFSSPYLPGGSRSGFAEDVYAPDFPY